MFHVKHRPSLPDAEVAEDHVEHVLDVNPAGQAAKRTTGEAKLRGNQLSLAGAANRQRTAQRVRRLLQCNTMALAGDQRGLGGAEGVAGESGEVGHKRVQPLPSQRRDCVFPLLLFSVVLACGDKSTLL